MFNQIKWAWQRVTKGYDETIMWGFDEYFINIIPALKEFCIKQLEDGRHKELNKTRSEKYLKTLDLIETWEKEEDWEREGWSFIKEDEALVALATYFGKNITAYWD